MHTSPQNFLIRLLRHLHVEPVLLVLCMCILPAVARLPSGLPGKDITEEYSRQLIERDSLPDKKTFHGPARIDSVNDSAHTWWLDSLAKTWDAPSLTMQLAQNRSDIPFGKGAVYIPCMSEPDREPSIEIVDSTGKLINSGRCGQQYALSPGTYRIYLGNGTYDQRYTQRITITKGKLVPLIPDWAGIKIEVVNERNVPIDESYELVRIDDFTPYGRGQGRSEQMGEKLKTWILPPGTYKIFGLGQSYNTPTNFITTRILPGELTDLVVVVNENNGEIVGGGRVNIAAKSALTPDWKYGFDIGGSLDFHSRNDLQNDSLNVTSSLALLFSSKAVYSHDPFEWTNRLDINQGLHSQGLKLRNIEIRNDELRLRSLFVWRFLKWIGPYTRASFECGLFPHYTHLQHDDSSKSYISIFDPDTQQIEEVDSTQESWRLGPLFSPVKLQIGAGTSLDLITRSLIETDFRVGLGIEKENVWDTYTKKDTAYDTIRYQNRGIPLQENARVLSLEKNKNINSLTVGPELIFFSDFSLAQWISDEIEFNMLLPFNNISEPDIDISNTVRLNISRAVTLDYVYRYTVSNTNDAASNLSTHRVLIRFSYTAR